MINWEQVNHTSYDKFITDIIETRGQWSDEVKSSSRGCERHHIIPRCAGGEPKKLSLSTEHHKNIIWLYPAEHFIAHQLLAKENPTNYSLTEAWWAMCCKNTNSPEKYIVTAEQYEEARQLSIDSRKQYFKDHPEVEEQRIVRQVSTKANKSQEQKDIENDKRSKSCTGYRWWTNGIDEVKTKVCPEGWLPGRKPKDPNSIIKWKSSVENRTIEKQEEITKKMLITKEKMVLPVVVQKMVWHGQHYALQQAKFSDVCMMQLNISTCHEILFIKKLLAVSLM